MNGEAKMVDAMREELGARVAKLRKRMKKARAGKPESIHQARTELRRMRVDLDTMGHTAFDARATAALGARLRRVERALAKTRDADVLLADLRARRKLANREDARALGAICERLERRRRRATGKARAVLGRRTRAALAAGVRDVMKSKNVVLHPPKKPARATPVLVRHFTHQEAWRRYEALRAYDARLPADVATLHELRSACRELRFTLEAFEQALPGLSAIAQALHRLQDEMGELHDHQVAIDRLVKWQRQGTIDESPALDRYLARRADARDELRSRFEPRWLGVLGESFRLSLARALEPHAPASAPLLQAA